jgi:hypothetical protein
MANWCNVRLLVAGQREHLAHFARRARLHSSEIFPADMLEGEAGALEGGRAKRVGHGLVKKAYRFQIRNDDGRRHFRRVSSRFPELRFVLTYFDPSSDSCGSYLVCRGRSRHFPVPEQRWEALIGEHGVLDEPDEDWRYWEASWAAMDFAEARWEPLISQPSDEIPP